MQLQKEKRKYGHQRKTFISPFWTYALLFLSPRFDISRLKLSCIEYVEICIIADKKNFYE